MNFNGSPFSLACPGVLHPHFNDYVRALDKIDNPSTEFASSIFTQQHILLNWFLLSTDIFQKCPRAPWSTNDEFTSSETPKTFWKNHIKIDICLCNRSWNSWWSRVMAGTSSSYSSQSCPIKIAIWAGIPHQTTPIWSPLETGLWIKTLLRICRAQRYYIPKVTKHIWVCWRIGHCWILVFLDII